jgi:predicted RNase H-like HicB family nuclease
MASATSDRDESERIVFVHEDDGSVTARDLETGLARGGDTRSEALAQLAEVLALHEGGGEPIDDPDEFLRAELDIDPDELEGDRDLPEFLR